MFSGPFPRVAHTSLGDLTAQQIIGLADEFSEIRYHDRLFELDSDIYHETRILLNFLAHRKPVHGHVRSRTEFYQSQIPVTVRPSLWVFGCSHSFGIGIKTYQRYSEILSKKIGLELILVAEPGSSLAWSLDQIYRSSITASDTVVWQITTPFRLMKYDGDLKHVILSNHATKCYLEIFTDQQILFDHLRLIRQGVAYLRSKNIRFVMTSLGVNNRFYYQYLNEYTQYPEYCYVPGFQVDKASDLQHPGPLSNQILADHLEVHIKSMTQNSS